jgi:Ca-activated chloride channel family protein
MQRILFVALIVLLPTGCDIGGPPRTTLTVLAGSELKDLSPYFETILKNTGIELDLHYIGTLDGAEELGSGAHYDLAWFSHAKYLSLLPETRGRIAAQEKIMLSPVILGVKQSTVDSWAGIDIDTIRWSEIAELAATGRLRFAMTNPAASNSGFTALLGVAAAFSDTGSALTSAEVNTKELSRFFAGQKLTSGSSGWLAEAYIREQDKLDGLINYESVLMSLNRSGALRDRLVLIYPQEGIVTADYPLMLLDNSKREAYDRLVAYLKSEPFQKIIMENTSRRPVIPQLRLSDDFSRKMLVELPFPADRTTIDRLIFTYLDEIRPPSAPVFVLDVSGSMRNERIDNLRQALLNLTGLDTSLTGKFARFRSREEISMVPFNHKIFPVQTFVIESGEDTGSGMESIRTFVKSLRADGGTAIYAALIRAYQIAGAEKRADPDRFYSIVLLSDGKNEHDIGYERFDEIYRKLPTDIQEIKTFTILFGGANVEEMNKVAELTGGRVFDGQKHSLAHVFKQIRGYQ